MSMLLMVVVALCVVSLITLVLQILALLRNEPLDLSDLRGLPAAVQALAAGGERVERALREEIAKNRDESQATSRHVREELAGQLKATSDSLSMQLSAAAQAADAKHEKLLELKVAGSNPVSRST